MKKGTIKECTVLLPTLIHLQELDHAYFWCLDVLVLVFMSN